MIGDVIHVTGKELFYSAMMLRLDKLVNVEYIYPTSESKRMAELNEAIETLRGKKLLTESAKNGISIDIGLMACAALCSNPDDCEVRKRDEYYATIYKSGDTFMLMERESDEQFAVAWFADKEELDDYVADKMNADVADKGDVADGGK